jgi:pimeloyl-ACP methyl ester carboxylesterase
MASDVDAVVNELSLSRFVIVGHSMGGNVAFAYASAHPGRIAGLLLADPTDDAQARPAVRRWLARILVKKFPFEALWNRILQGAQPQVKAAVLDDLRDVPRGVLIDVIRANADFDASAALAKYPGPAISIITRMNDVSSALHRVSSRVRAVRVEGTSHWLQMDDPAEFNRLMDEFLIDAGWQERRDQQHPGGGENLS